MFITGKEQNIYGKLKCRYTLPRNKYPVKINNWKKIEQKAVFTNFTCRVFQSFLSIHTARHTLNGELAMPVGICRYLITRSPAMSTTERDSWSTLVHWWRPREGTWWTRRRDGSSTSMCAGTLQQVNQISTDLLRWYGHVLDR